MATGLTLATTLPTSWSTAQSEQFWIDDYQRQVHAQLLVGRPDGYTWEDVTSYLVRAEVELGDVSGVGTGGTGADAVVRRMTFTVQNEGALIPAWSNTTAQDENYVVGDESDVVGVEQDSAARFIDRLFGTTHRYARDGFSPRDQNSAFNIFGGGFAPLLKPNREVALRAAVTPIGEQPNDLDWVTLFQGLIDSSSTSGSDVTVQCRDLAKRLMYTYIYEQEEFGDDDNPIPAATVIQQILDRYVKTATPQLYVPKAPVFTCGRFRTQYESVWDAIQKVAAQFGWFLGYRWVPSLGAFRLVLMEPPRLKNAGSADFVLSHVKSVYDHTDEMGDQYIGNLAVVRFTEAQTGERRTVVVRNEESIAEWEERAMEFSEGELSLIDTEEEAIAFGVAAVTDCGGIIGSKRVIAPFLPSADVFSGAVIADPRISSTEDFMGVVSVRHVLDFDAKVFETEMVGQSRVVGGDKRWRKMLTRPGAHEPRPPEDVVGGGKVMPKPASVSARGIIRGVSVDVPVPPVNANRWKETEVHLSPTQGFTPSESTLVAAGRETHFEITDDGTNPLVSGETYYLRARYIDMTDSPGPFSDEVDAEADYTTGLDLSGDLNPDGSVRVGDDGIRRTRDGAVQLFFQWAQIGEANDGETISFPGFQTEPKITLMPVALQTYDPGESSSGQRVVLRPYNIRYDEQDEVWKADILCRLAKTGVFVNNSLNQQLAVSQSYTTPGSDPVLELTTAIGIAGTLRAQVTTSTIQPGPCEVRWEFKIETRKVGSPTWDGPGRTSVYVGTVNVGKLPRHLIPYTSNITASFDERFELPSNGNWELRITYNSATKSGAAWTMNSNRLDLTSWKHSSDQLLEQGRALYIALEGGA